MCYWLNIRFGAKKQSYLTWCTKDVAKVIFNVISKQQFPPGKNVLSHSNSNDIFLCHNMNAKRTNNSGLQTLPYKTHNYYWWKKLCLPLNRKENYISLELPSFCVPYLHCCYQMGEGFYFQYIGYIQFYQYKSDIHYWCPRK